MYLFPLSNSFWNIPKLVAPGENTNTSSLLADSNCGLAAAKRSPRLAKGPWYFTPALSRTGVILSVAEPASK